MKDRLIVMATAAAGVAYSHVGGWSLHLKVLVTLMMIDFAVGLLLTFAGKSKKSTERIPDSKIAINGFLRKCLCLTMVLVMYLLDMLVGSSYASDMVTLGLIVNEVISLTEHWRMAGLYIPKVLLKVLDALKEKAGEGDDRNGRNDSG